ASGTDGQCDEKGGGGRPRGLPGRSYPAQAQRLGVQPDRRPDRLMTDPFSSPGAKTPPKPFTLTEGRREVRSFVLRQGRFTEAQQRAFDTQWPRFGLDYTGTVRDYDAVFGRHAPRVLEIGFGNGEALRFAAAHDQDRDYLGLEVH